MHSDYPPLLHGITQSNRYLAKSKQLSLGITILGDEPKYTIVLELALYSTTGDKIRSLGSWKPDSIEFEGTQSQAWLHAVNLMLKHLNDNYTWHTSAPMKTVRKDCQPFLNFCMRQGADLREFPNL